MAAPYPERATGTTGANAEVAANGSVFSSTSHCPAPLSSTHTLAPGIKADVYGNINTSLAWATRMVCRLNANPEPTTGLVMVNAIAIDVRPGVANTRYTPSTRASKNLIMTTSPTAKLGGLVNVTMVVPFRFGVAELM